MKIIKNMLYMLLSFSSISVVFALPVPVTINIRAPVGDAKRKFLGDLKTSINQDYIRAMLRAVDYPSEPKSKVALEAAFGRSFKDRLSMIRKKVEKIQSYDATIGKITGQLNAIAAYQSHKKEIWLKSDFYALSGDNGKPPKTPGDWKLLLLEAAPVMIHEISHAALETVDYFTKDLEPDIDHVKCHDRPEDCYSGYLDKDYKMIRDKHPLLQLQNADAFFVFSHVALYGDVDIKTKMLFASKDKWALT